jgi:hypothetical protein
MLTTAEYRLQASNAYFDFWVRKDTRVALPVEKGALSDFVRSGSVSTSGGFSARVFLVRQWTF